MVLPPSPARKRRGIGVLLVVILSFVVVLTIVGLAQRYLTSAVSGQTQRASIGELCLELSESLGAEVLEGFRRQVNDPGSPLFKALRQDVYGNELGNLDLSEMIKVPHFDALLKADPTYAKFYRKEYKAEIVYQRQFEDLPYERFGLLRVRARVQFDLALTETIGREVELGVGFKTLLVGPPRPFDQPNWLMFVKDNTQSELNFADLNAKKREWTALVKDTRDSANMRAADVNTPEQVKAEYKDVLSQVQASDVYQAALPDLPSERVVLFSTKPGGTVTNFEDLFIFKRLEELEKAELEPARKEVERGELGVITEVNSVEKQRALAAAYRRQAVALSKLLKTMTDHRAMFELWEGAGFDSLDRFRYKLEDRRWIQKPFYVVKEADGPLDAQVKRISSAVRPLNGVLRCDNPHAVLNLDNIHIPGKLVIVVGTGGVHLANVNREERANDLLTVISVGGPIVIEGEVHAAVLGSQGASLSASPGATVQGLLVLDQVPSPNDRSFRVIREDKYYSGATTEKSAAGAFADYYYVGVSPMLTYRKVVRR